MSIEKCQILSSSNLLTSFCDKVDYRKEFANFVSLRKHVQSSTLCCKTIWFNQWTSI